MKKLFYLSSLTIFISLLFLSTALSQAISKELHQKIEDETPYESVSLYKDTNGLVSVYWGKSNVSFRHLQFTIKIWEMGTLQAADTLRLVRDVYQADEFPFIPIKKRKQTLLEPGKQYMVEVQYLVRIPIPGNKIAIKVKKIQNIIIA